MLGKLKSIKPNKKDLFLSEMVRNMHQLVEENNVSYEEIGQLYAETSKIALIIASAEFNTKV